MAANRVGALYYEVMLNPRGFSEGANVVVSQQRMLKKAAKDTITPHEALQAELHQYLQLAKQIDDADPYEGQKESLQIVLNKVDQLIAKQEELKKKQYDEETAARVEKLTQERLDAEEELTKEAEKQNDIQQRYLAIARARQEREDKRIAEEKQAQKEREEAARQAEKDAKEQEIAEKKRIDEMVKNFYYLQKVKKNSLKLEQDQIKEAEDQQKRNHDAAVARSLERLKNFRQYGLSIDGLSRAFADVKMQVTEVNGGLSKMAGNLAQAAGMTPAMQGLARVLGSVGLKALGIGFGLAMFVKTGMSSVKLAEKLRLTLVRLKNALGGNELMADALNRQLEELSIRAGVSADSMRELGKSLITMGISPGDIEGTAKMIAMLSEGDPTKMKSIAKAYTDTMSKTRLMGQEALQFANAGVPIYLRLQKITGKTKEEVTKMMESGEITVELLDKALALQAEMIGGDAVFKENMESITGLTNKMSQSIRHIKEIIGEPFRQVFVMALKPIAAIVGFVEQQFVTLQHMFRDVEVPILRIFSTMERIEKAKKGEMSWIEALDPIGGVALGRNIMEIALGRRQLEYETLELEMKMEATAKRTQAVLDEELRIEKERNENYQDMMTGLNDQLLTEEQLRDAEFERLIMSKEMTDEQRKQLKNRYYEVENEKKRREEEKKALEERKKAEDELKKKLEDDLKLIDGMKREREQEAHAEAKRAREEIDKTAQKKESEFDKAAGMAGASFDAGSREEYQFLRQKQLENTKAAKEEQWQKKAAEERANVNKNLNRLISAITQDADLETAHAQLAFEGAMANLP